MRGKIAAFTLAEVLITLGIIGIVAAMTMPSLINNYRSNVLHNQFKKGYSNLSKAFMLTKEELGESDIRRSYATYDKYHGIYPNAKEFYAAFNKAIGVKEKIQAYKILNYTKNTSFGDVSYICGTGCPQPIYLLADGSSINTLVNSGTIFFDIDTNGPNKGPNRYGFDVFTFQVNSNDALVPVKMSKVYSEEELENELWPTVVGEPCSISSSQQGNGYGCSYYALNDINPDDNTKSYWKNLPW